MWSSMRKMAFSLPGMMRAERITVSRSSSVSRRWLSTATRESEDIGSAWLPLTITTIFSGGKRIDVLRANHQAVRNAQAVHAVGQFHVIDHAAADEGNFPPRSGRDVNDLLDARNRRREAGHDHLARGRARQFLDARANAALGRRVAGPLDIGAVAEQREDAFRAVAREGMQVKRLPVDRRLVHLEIAGVNHDADRSANRQRHAVDGAVRDAYELHFENADFDFAPGNDFAQIGLVEQAVFFQALLYQRQREARAVDRRLQVAQYVGQRADVIFVTVRQKNGAQVLRGSASGR